MRATTTTTYEGTLEEILAALPYLRNVHPADTTAGLEHVSIQSAEATDEDETDEDEEISYVSTRVARRVLNRIKLHDVQKDLLVALCHAHPGTMLASELQGQIGYSPAQFAGLMGSWGRRVSHTEGYDDEYFFIQNWDHDAGCMRYGLPDSVREAMELEGLI
jgi:hypothetical protein